MCVCSMSWGPTDGQNTRDYMHLRCLDQACHVLHCLFLQIGCQLFVKPTAYDAMQQEAEGSEADGLIHLQAALSA